MKKRCLIIIMVLLLLCGCENKEEKEKNEYIAMKTKLLDEENYTDEDNLPLDITISIDRVDTEVVNYKVVFKNPQENMHNIKAMIVHNYNNEDVYPSIGVFDETKELLVNEESEIELTGSIRTAKNISKLNLNLKVWIEYTNDLKQIKDVYYKTT